MGVEGDLASGGREGGRGRREGGREGGGREEIFYIIKRPFGPAVLSFVERLSSFRGDFL